MAGLYDSQAHLYVAARPDYPSSLFAFLASLTPHHQRAWDVGTGNGQAAVAVAEHYDTVIATDVSEPQLRFALQRDNVTYACTSASMSEEELHKVVGAEGSVDLVTVATAVHWFDLDSFYGQVKHVLRKPGGIFAVWGYIYPSVNDEVDAVCGEFLNGPYVEYRKKEAGTKREAGVLLAEDRYRSLPFPFESVLDDGRGTGPIQFDSTKEMKLEGYLNFIRSWSVLQNAKAQGVELLDEKWEETFRAAWGQEDPVLTVTFPMFMRVGGVHTSSTRS